MITKLNQEFNRFPSNMPVRLFVRSGRPKSYKLPSLFFTMKLFKTNIEKEVLKNNYFRRVLFTGKYEQLFAMTLKPKEEIGNEVHKKVDQFFRIEQGEAKFVLFNGKKTYTAKTDDAVIVPAGTWHNVINTSKTKKLKLYTIYSPPNHKPNTIHKTKEEAELAEH